MLQDLNNAVLQTLQKNDMKSVTWNFLRKLRKIQIHQQIQGSVTERSETDYCWLYCARQVIQSSIDQADVM